MKSMLHSEIVAAVDRLKSIKDEIDALKAEAEQHEAALLRQFEADTEDTKNKSVTYEGNTGKATVAYASSVKLLYPSLLRQIFGDAYGDVVKEETTYKLSESAKRLIAAIYKREYVANTSIDGIITGLLCDDKAKKALEKKLKGKNFKTDKNNLVTLAGLSEDSASDYAYLVAESAAWQNFVRLLSVSGSVTPERISTVLKYIDDAVSVEEPAKITIE